MKGLNNEEKLLIEKVAKIIAERHLTVPAILFLEMAKPLSFVGSSLIAFMGPVLQCVIPPDKTEAFRQLLEDRDNVEFLIQQIEKYE